MLRLEGPSLPPESQGAIPPILMGDLHRDVPGIPLQVGRSATLADNCGLTLTGLVLRLAGPDVEAVLAAAPSTGVVQIDDEWLSYSAIVLGPPRLVISARGFGGTVPATHEKGAEVYFVESRPLYAFAYVPEYCTYPDDAVTQVRINDNAEIPAHTIRLQDDRIVPGHRLLTVEFDLSRSFNAPPTPAVPATFFIAGGSDGVPTWRERLRVVGWRVRVALGLWRPRPIAGGAGALGAGGATSTASAGGAGGGASGAATGVLRVDTAGSGSTGAVHIPLPPRTLRPVTVQARPPARSAQPRTASASVSSFSAGGGAPRTALRLLQLPLGRVTADIKGLLDTPSGRYTGTPTAPIRLGAHQTRVLLEHGFGERDAARYDLPTWDATAARHAALGYTWRSRYAGESFDAVREAVQTCGQADLYLGEDGRWRYQFREPTEAAVATITPRELVGDPDLSWSPGREVITVLDVTWGEGLQTGAFTLESPAMMRRHGRNAGSLGLPYAATEGVARMVARYWLSQWDRPKQSATVVPTHAHLALTLRDRLFVETDLLTLYGGTRVPWEVIGVTDRGAQRVLALREADPLALALLCSGRLVADATFGIPLTGSLTPPGLEVPLSGRVILDMAFDVPLSGSLEGAEGGAAAAFLLLADE